MPLPAQRPASAPSPARTGALLIGATCLGSGIALAAGRQLLLQLAPPLTPATSPAALERIRHQSVDPLRRRDAALLLSSDPQRTAQQRRQLLQGQGWGRSALAATALKQAAQAASASGAATEATALWQLLLQRFPHQAASADALYALGGGSPALRRQLLQRFPAHPAALAAALEAGYALHLARWGARWPGAEPLLLARCERRQPALTGQKRQQLAAGLVDLGRGPEALRCLQGQPPGSALQLGLGRSLLRGNSAEQQQGEQLLLRLAQTQPASPEAQEATALLAEQPEAAGLALLRQLPPSLQDSAAVQARLALEGQRPWAPVLQRWPRDPASWELQWQLARRALLQDRWAAASTVLQSLPSRLLPAPLAARQLFWQGYSAQRQGRSEQARAAWQQLLQVQPVGYYSWRARVRLDAADAGSSGPAAAHWQPLESGDTQLDDLWRTGQVLEAWETWRHRQMGHPPQGAAALQLEGRLRTAIHDDWTGLGQLELASLRLPQTSCHGQWLREQQLHPRRFPAAFQQAATGEGVEEDLLQGVAKQESRFTPAVGSVAGAIGLLQLMPATAAELAGAPQSRSQLEDPAHNAQLGARYLRQLLAHWQGQGAAQPFLAVASYNAGPGAVQGWLGAGHPDVQRDPELWTEAIPYPETRLYTKKVLGNLWSYRQLRSGRPAGCDAAQPR